MSRPLQSPIEALFADPHRFDFFQAVRLLERWFTQQEQLAGDAALTQRLRFRNSLSLAFPASEIAALTATGHDGEPLAPDADGGSRAIRHVALTPAFMGLLGAGGALPLFYTELFAERESKLNGGDTTARAFLDIFQQRAVLLMVQAWRKSRLPLRDEADRRRHYLPMLLSFAGLGHPSLHDRLQPRRGGVADDTLAFYAGVLRHRPVGVSAMQRVLAQYFGVAVKIDSFVGRWFTLPAANQSTLGIGNVTLGGGLVVGERVWQRDLRMRVTLGPLTQARFRRFLPGGAGALALRELLTLMTGVSIEYEVRLSLAAAEVQPMRLDADDAPLLGWSSFLVTEPAANDRSDAGYDIHAAA